MKFASATLAIVLAAAIGGTALAASVIKERQEKMETIGKQMGGTLVKMVKGEIPYDAAKAKAAVQTIGTAAQGFDALFPKGSETGEKTEAAPAIWTDTAGFKAALAKLQETVTAQADVAGSGPDGLKAAVTALGGACKGCHDTYRQKK